MYYDLNKREKKIARILIDKGVDIEYKRGLEKAKQVIAEWENGNLDNRTAYLKLFKTVEENDKRIGKRYNDLGGSRYLITVAAILYDEQITEDDIKDFSDETREIIRKWIGFWKDGE